MPRAATVRRFSTVGRAPGSIEPSGRYRLGFLRWWISLMVIALRFGPLGRSLGSPQAWLTRYQTPGLGHVLRIGLFAICSSPTKLGDFVVYDNDSLGHFSTAANLVSTRRRIPLFDFWLPTHMSMKGCPRRMWEFSLCTTTKDILYLPLVFYFTFTILYFYHHINTYTNSRTYNLVT